MGPGIGGNIIPGAGKFGGGMLDAYRPDATGPGIGMFVFMGIGIGICPLKGTGCGICYCWPIII